MPIAVPSILRCGYSFSFCAFSLGYLLVWCVWSESLDFVHPSPSLTVDSASSRLRKKKRHECVLCLPAGLCLDSFPFSHTHASNQSHPQSPLNRDALGPGHPAAGTTKQLFLLFDASSQPGQCSPLTTPLSTYFHIYSLIDLQHEVKST